MSHPQPNFERMIQIIEEVFATRNDPDQLQVDEKSIRKLEAIHPACLSQVSNDQGPLIWALLIPTTRQIMIDFMAGKISEQGILDLTPEDCSYNSIYLCSATTLPELRGKGETKKLCLRAIETIRADHPIGTLFVWAFTKEGERLAEVLGAETKLPLLMAGKRR